MISHSYNRMYVWQNSLFVTSRMYMSCQATQCYPLFNYVMWKANSDQPTGVNDLHDMVLYIYVWTRLRKLSDQQFLF